MNILPAQKIKRRGVKAIELALKDGPVHIIKNNSPACVVLTEAQYALPTNSFYHKAITLRINTVYPESYFFFGDSSSLSVGCRLRYNLAFNESYAF